MTRIITNSEAETLNFAENYIKNKINGGDIIALSGNLGAGKTIFSKGVALGLGITKTINSPTFVIMKVYDTKMANIKKMCHIDAYRTNEDGILGIGAEEYFNRVDTVTIIEWAENIKKILPKKTKFITIKYLDKDKREINY